MLESYDRTNEEWLERFLKVLKENFGEEFTRKVLYKIKAPPKFIKLYEVFKREYGAIECCLEHYFDIGDAKRNFYVISQSDHNGKRVQGVLQGIDRVTTGLWKKHVGSLVRIYGIMCEYQKSILKVSYDPRISIIVPAGRCFPTAPRHLKSGEQYFSVSGYIVDISWNYSETYDEDFWFYLTLGDPIIRVTITSRGHSAVIMKNAFTEAFGEDLPSFDSKREYLEYKTILLSKLLYFPVKITSERYMKCNFYEGLRLRTFNSKRNLDYALSFSEISDEELLGDVPLGVYEHGLIGEVQDIVEDSTGMSWLEIKTGEGTTRVAIHLESTRDLALGDKIVILYGSQSILYKCMRGEAVVLSDRTYDKILVEYQRDREILLRILSMPRIRVI
ncbi:MAG: hypothetical protein DRN30_03560 [Thermoplasmata archaeon]|nr:MAG: hypothetical protein DRN30_03560 [Thermoplasmata archaeon]